MTAAEFRSSLCTYSRASFPLSRIAAEALVHWYDDRARNTLLARVTAALELLRWSRSIGPLEDSPVGRAVRSGPRGSFQVRTLGRKDCGTDHCCGCPPLHPAKDRYENIAHSI